MKRTCAIDGCEQPVNSRGWCRAHYSRYQRTGDPLGSGKPIGKPRGRKRTQAECTVDGCERQARTRGFCHMHHQRVLATGDPGPAGNLPKGHSPAPPTERFWAKVTKTETCWLWTGNLMANGYGCLFYATAENRVLPHRFSYELANGPIPAGLDIDHMCHVRHCVNPMHLQAVNRTLNNENRGVVNRNSSTGVRGVSYDSSRRKYIASATSARKTYHGGRFDTIEEAETAAIALRNRLMTNNLLDRTA